MRPQKVECPLFLTKNIAALTNDVPYAPVRTSALQYVPEAMKPHLSTTHDLGKGVGSDMRWSAEHETRVNERFQTWLARK